MKPTVSIILPTYNSRKYIYSTLRSIFDQSFKSWELIIIDDCSSDGTYEDILINYISSKKIKILRNKKNSGPGYSRNKGLKLASGKYIAFIDSDDLWCKSKLHKQVRFMKKFKVNLSFTSCYYLKQNKKFINNFKIPNYVTYNSLLRVNYITTSTVMIKNRFLNNIKFSYDGYDDYIMWLTILKHCKGYFLNKKLTYYRILKNSVSSKKIRSFFWIWNIYRKHENFSFWKSSYHMVIICMTTLKKKTSYREF